VLSFVVPRRQPAQKLYIVNACCLLLYYLIVDDVVFADTVRRLPCWLFRGVRAISAYEGELLGTVCILSFAVLSSQSSAASLRSSEPVLERGQTFVGGRPGVLIDGEPGISKGSSAVPPRRTAVKRAIDILKGIYMEFLLQELIRVIIGFAVQLDVYSTNPFAQLS
jgi:hypothetical protein